LTRSAAWLRGDNASESSGNLLTTPTSTRLVYRAINVLAEQVANIPFLFLSCDAARILITSGPLQNVFYDHPPPHLKQIPVLELRIIWLMLCGELLGTPETKTAPRSISQ